MTEYETEIDDSVSYRTEPFEETVVSLEVKEIGDYTQIVFELEEGPMLSIFPLKTINVVDGKALIPDWHGHGYLLNSLIKQGYKVIQDIEDGELVGIRTEPDIEGKTVAFDVVTNKWTDKTSGEEKTRNKWFITSIKDDTPVKQTGVSEEPKKEDSTKEETTKDDVPDMDTEAMWIEVIDLHLVDTTKTLAELQKAMKEVHTDTQVQTELSKVRNATLAKLETDGYILKENGRYRLAE